MKYILLIVLSCIALLLIIARVHLGALDYFQHKSYKIVRAETFVANPHPIDSVKIFGESGDFDSIKIYSGEWLHTRRTKGEPEQPNKPRPYWRIKLYSINRGSDFENDSWRIQDE